MDLALQNLLLAKLKKAGGKMEKDYFYTDLDVIQYMNKGVDPVAPHDPLKNTTRIHSAVDHNLSLLEDSKRIKTYLNQAAIMGMTGVVCELTPQGYELPTDRIVKLQSKINEMDELKANEPWGAKYNVWNDLVEKILSDDFGNNALSLFQKETSVALTTEGFNKEVEQRRTLLEAIIKNADSYKPENGEDVKAAMLPPPPAPTTIINNSNVHYGVGDNVGGDANPSHGIGLSIVEKVAVAVVVTLFFYFIYKVMGINLSNFRS